MIMFAATSLEYFFESFGVTLENAYLWGETSHALDFFVWFLSDIFNTV